MNKQLIIVILLFLVAAVLFLVMKPNDGRDLVKPVFKPTPYECVNPRCKHTDELTIESGRELEKQLDPLVRGGIFYFKCPKCNQPSFRTKQDGSEIILLQE